MEDKIMKKSFILMALAILSLSCAKEIEINNENAQPSHKADFREVTITAFPEHVETKTYFDKSTGALTWTSNESNLAVYDGTDLQAFTYEGATDGKASFTGTADVAAASWTAVHPASHAALEGGKVYVTFPCIQEAREAGGLKADMNTVAAQVTHDGAGNIDDCVMKNVGGLLKLTVAKTGIKTITVSSRGGQALTGKAELSFDGSGNPVVTPVATKYETFVTLKAANLSTGLAAGEYFVSVFPAAMSNGLLIDMENIDGTVASIKTTKSATVNRNSDLEFSGFDTSANWYTPDKTTMELKFLNVTWPFVETTNGGATNADATKWAGKVERQLTYSPDNNILFYVNCSNYCSANGGNGLRMGKGQGDYFLFPAISGKNLTKVEVKYVNGKTDKTLPAIKTRGGSDIVLGGNATSSITAGTDTWQTWNLVGTAHNMQYRYELTFSGNDVTYIEQINLTYASKPSSIVPPTPDPADIVLDLTFYDGANLVNPFNETVKMDGTQYDYSSTAGTYTFTAGGKTYYFVFEGGKIRWLSGTNSGERHGLAFSSNTTVLLPTIAGYRLSHIKTAYTGQAAGQDNPSLPNRSCCITSDKTQANAIWTKTFKGGSFPDYPTVDEDLSATVVGTNYYFLVPSGWFYIPYLTLTYTLESSPSPAPAPAQLLDGGVTIL